MSEKEISPAVDPIRSDRNIQSDSTKDLSHGSAELDENYQLYKASDPQDIDPAEAKRVLRKIDLRIIPILFVTYLLQVSRSNPYGSVLHY